MKMEEFKINHTPCKHCSVHYELPLLKVGGHTEKEFHYQKEGTNKKQTLSVILVREKCLIFS